MAATKEKTPAKPVEVKTYKTVAKLLKGYEKGELSSRKNKITLPGGSASLARVFAKPGGTGDDHVVFEMGISEFIKQVAKLGGVKLPIA